MKDKIIVLFPTQGEAAAFLESGGAGRVAGVEICGVGIAEAAAATAAAIIRYAPSTIVLAGIAGAYPRSPFKVGDVLLVGSELIADLGAMHPAGFKPMYVKRYDCPYASNLKSLPKGASNTVSTAALPFLEVGNADVENMEGAGMFAVCLKAGVPFLEVRAVSNPVSASHRRWNIPLAVENLSRGLNRLLDEIG